MNESVSNAWDFVQSREKFYRLNTYGTKLYAENQETDNILLKIILKTAEEFLNAKYNTEYNKIYNDFLENLQKHANIKSKLNIINGKIKTRFNFTGFENYRNKFNEAIELFEDFVNDPPSQNYLDKENAYKENIAKMLEEEQIDL